MTRRGNIQHGQARRMPWSVRVPIAILCVELVVLGWMVVELARALN